MYVNPNNHNNRKRNSGYFYIALSVLAAVFILAAIIALPSVLVSADPPATDPPAPATDPTPATDPITDTPTDTSVPDVTEPPATETLPFDTGTDTLPPETDTEPPETPIVNTGAVLGETEDAGQSYVDKIIFIGDSTTYSFLYYGVLSEGTSTKQVWTPASRTLTLDAASTTTILYPDTGEEILIKDAIARKKPEIVVITLGVNGISYMYDEKDYFVKSYTKLINQIQEASPETKIILQSIFPVATNWEKLSINNERISLGNGWVHEIAESTGVSYLDTHSVLAIEEGGYLLSEYQNGDGLHLNTTGLNVVLSYIRTHALPGYAAPISNIE